MKQVYLLLAILGAVLPYSQFIPWLLEHGLDLLLLWQHITETRISAFAWSDVVLTVITIIFFVINDSKQRGKGISWWPILGCLTVGASFGLPLYLYLRESSRAELG